MKKSTIKTLTAFAVAYFGLGLVQAQTIIDYDGKAAGQSIGRAIFPGAGLQFRLQVAKPENVERGTPLKPRALSEGIGKCDPQDQTKFYKSLNFVNGILASADFSTLKGCVSVKEVSDVMSMKGADLEDYSHCVCSSGKKQCETGALAYCFPSGCKGSCKETKSAFGASAGDLDMSDVFSKLPENLAREFAGSIILDNGKVTGYDRGLLSKNLPEEKIRNIVGSLTGK